MKNNVLFTITNLNIIDKLKEKGINNFVYPLSFFCVVIPNTFTIDQIKEDNAYLFVNRILDCKSIEKLKSILKNLPNNIKGIIFDDVGLIEVLKDINIKKILYNTHFNTNYESVNYFFEYVDDIILPNDITEEEIDEIISKTNKKISLFIFGLVPTLYSRRTLLKNHAIFYDIDYENIKKLNVNSQKFISIENEYGTMMYHYPYFNGTRLLNKEVSFLFYFPILLDNDKLLKILENDFMCIETDEGFLDTKTIYKVKNN